MGEDLDKEGDSVMIMAMPPSKGVRSTKRKRELEEARLSLMAVLGKNLKEMAPMVLARLKKTAYKRNSVTRNLAEVLIEMENATGPGTEEDFRPQKANAKKDSISGQMREVDIDKKWIPQRHQGIVKQVASDPLEEDLRERLLDPGG